MTQKKSAILIGDNLQNCYHPLAGVEKELVSIFQDLIAITVTDQHDSFLSDQITKYDLCICYVDRWGMKMSDGQASGLVDYVQNGGGLLLIHNGISYQEDTRFFNLTCVRFIQHPPYQKLKFINTLPSNAIMSGINDFYMEEEPYAFEFDPLKNREVFLEYEIDGALKPAGWSYPFGAGNVVYLMPGHNASSFANVVYREIIRRSGMWLLGIDPL